jgi:hypothetical protein
MDLTLSDSEPLSVAASSFPFPLFSSRYFAPVRGLIIGISKRIFPNSPVLYARFHHRKTGSINLLCRAAPAILRPAFGHAARIAIGVRLNRGMSPSPHTTITFLSQAEPKSILLVNEFGFQNV